VRKIMLGSQSVPAYGHLEWRVQGGDLMVEVFDRRGRSMLIVLVDNRDVVVELIQYLHDLDVASWVADRVRERAWPQSSSST